MKAALRSYSLAVSGVAALAALAALEDQLQARKIARKATSLVQPRCPRENAISLHVRSGM
jgi:hypothetical protein